MPMKRTPIIGRGLKEAAFTDQCTVLTIIEWSAGTGHEHTANNVTPAGVTVDTKEHDSLVEALEYLDTELRAGGFDRVHLINASELGVE